MTSVGCRGVSRHRMRHSTLIDGSSSHQRRFLSKLRYDLIENSTTFTKHGLESYCFPGSRSPFREIARNSIYGLIFGRTRQSPCCFKGATNRMLVIAVIRQSTTILHETQANSLIARASGVSLAADRFSGKILSQISYWNPPSRRSCSGSVTT